MSLMDDCFETDVLEAAIPINPISRGPPIPFCRSLFIISITFKSILDSFLLFLLAFSLTLLLISVQHLFHWSTVFLGPINLKNWSLSTKQPFAHSESCQQSVDPLQSWPLMPQTGFFVRFSSSMKGNT